LLECFNLMLSDLFQGLVGLTKYGESDVGIKLIKLTELDLVLKIMITLILTIVYCK
jgi:hypothetical protein